MPLKATSDLKNVIENNIAFLGLFTWHSFIIHIVLIITDFPIILASWILVLTLLVETLGVT